MSDENIGENQDAQTPVADGESDKKDDKGAEKIFTQEDVNRIVSKRVNKLQSQLEESVKKVEIFDGMMQDDDFRTWLEGKASGNTSRGGDKRDENNIALTKIDPEFGPVIAEYVQKALAPILEQLGGIGQGLSKTQKEINEDRAIKAVQDMINFVDKDGKSVYPLMKENEVREAMATLIENKRVTTLQDAYDLVAVDRARKGGSLLGDGASGASPRSNPKQDAELLEGIEGGEMFTETNTGDSVKPPRIFKSFEECFNTVADERGWNKKK